MRKISTLLLAAAFVGGIATAAIGAETRSGTQSQPYESMHSSSSAPSSSATMPSADFKGVHTMEGTISKIDHKDGKLSVKTSDAGTLDLHFPPDAIKNMKDGERVTVSLGIAPASETMGSRSNMPR